MAIQEVSEIFLIMYQVKINNKIGIKKEFSTIKEGTEFIKKFIKITSLSQVQEVIEPKFGFIEREEGKLKVEECAKKNLLGYKTSIKETTKSKRIV